MIWTRSWSAGDIQATKFNRDPPQPLPWDALGEERGGIKVIEANRWFVAFPSESFEVDTVVFQTGADALRAAGVYISIGTKLRTVEPAE